MMNEWTHSWAWSSGSPFIAALAMLCFWLLCFTPSLIAILRRHRSSAAIVVMNILLGWTGVGWICAFVWSLSWPGHDRPCHPCHPANPA
jgi:hypothetical protein